MKTKKMIASAALAGGLFSASAFAAQVSWGGVFEVASDADLRLAGRQVVYAVRGGDGNPSGAATPVTVGGQTVSFAAVTGLYGPGSTFGATTYGDAVDHLAGQDYPVTFDVVSERGTNHPLVSFDPGAGSRTTYAPTTGNAGLDSLLNSQIWTDGRTAGTTAFKISLNDLVPGASYEVQIIAAADSRTNKYADSTYSVSDDQSTPSIAMGLAAFADVDHDGASHVTSLVGDFVASGTSQPIDLLLTKDRNPGISAIIVTQAATVVPEPTALVPAGLAVVALRRRRR